MITTTDWNVTQSTMVSNSIPMGAMMALITVFIVVAFIIGIIWYAGSTLPRYKRLWAVLLKVATVVVSAFVGAAVIGVVVILYLLLSELFKAVGTFDPMWIVYAIGGFALCAIVGAAVLLLVDRLQANVEAEKLEKEVKQE